MHEFMSARGRLQHARRDVSCDVTRGPACARSGGLNTLTIPRMRPCRRVREAIARADTRPSKRVTAPFAWIMWAPRNRQPCAALIQSP